MRIRGWDAVDSPRRGHNLKIRRQKPGFNRFNAFAYACSGAFQYRMKSSGPKPPSTIRPKPNVPQRSFCARALFKPFDALLIVLRHSSAFNVHHAKECLGWGKVLLGGLVEPRRGLGVIPSHPPTFHVPDTEIELAGGDPLFGRLAEPFDGFGIVLCYTQPFSVHNAESVLCVRISLFGGPAPQPKCLAVPFGSLIFVAGYLFSEPIQMTEGDLAGARKSCSAAFRYHFTASVISLPRSLSARTYWPYAKPCSAAFRIHFNVFRSHPSLLQSLQDNTLPEELEPRAFPVRRQHATPLHGTELAFSKISFALSCFSNST